MLCFALAGAIAQSQADPQVIEKIVDLGKNQNKVMEHLTYLTENIGPRLSSSPQLQRACEWTASQFKKYGLKNVQLEHWGDFPVGFERGKRQVGKMVSPYERNFEFTTSSWTPGTNGPVRGPAVLAPTSMTEFESMRDKLKGAWVISTTAQPGRGQQPGEEQQKLDEAIANAGIAGIVRGSRNDLVITSGRYAGLEWGKLPKTVRVMVRKQDMDAILYNLDQKRNVELLFDLEQRFVKGPRPLYNVVAEIPGTEKPDEVVIVSGHLDSWDGPGSTGTCDNGTGTMVALEAARLLMQAGAKPKRTIRFILWTGEEQGLLGSRAYVAKHKDELSKISCVFVDDGGTNYQGGVSCLASMEPMLKEAFAPAMAAFPEMPMRISVVERMPRGGGSDHASFNAVGVPGFFWFETGRADYGFVHHTQHDKLEHAIPEYLVQSSVNTACASYIIACAETLLPREVPATPPSGEGGGGQ